MIKRFCDRCDKEIIDKEQTFFEEIANKLKDVIGTTETKYSVCELEDTGEDTGRVYNYELCDECASKLKEWFENPKGGKS